MVRIKAESEELISEFFRLVQTDSESPHCQKMVAFLTNVFRIYLGLDAIEQKADDGSNLLFRIPGTIADAKPLLIAAHMDTVSPGRGIIPVLEDGKITAKTDTILGADDKSAIAVILYGLKLAKENNLPLIPLEIVFTYGEEAGLLGSRKFDYSLLKARNAICLDSEGNAGIITVSAPYYEKFDIEIHGRAAHSGIEPEKGINAIQILSHAISRLRWGRIDSTTTANIGNISGGRALNIVPDYATASGEVRSPVLGHIKKYLARIKKACSLACRKYKGRFKFQVAREFDGYVIPEDDPFLLEIIESVRKTGLKPVLQKSNGGSDANIFNVNGIKTLNLSCGMMNPHTKKEYVTVKNLQSTLRMLLSIVSRNNAEVVF
jgi:tripeptide aminopeptidase